MVWRNCGRDFFFIICEQQMQQYFEGHLEGIHKQDVYAFYLTVNATKEGCCVEFSGGYNKETVSTCQWRLPAFVRFTPYGWKIFHLLIF